MADKCFKFLSASGYKLRCKSKCVDIIPVYGDCICSSCSNGRREQIHTQQADECIAQAQSGEIISQDTEPAGNRQEHENVTFAHETEANLLMLDDEMEDHTFEDSFQENGSLGNFLSRPVLIFSYEWQVGNVIPAFFGFNPWQLLLSQGSITNKFRNFKLLSGKLHLKFLINGSPFHYGRFFVGIRPTKFDNNTTTFTPSTSTVMSNMVNSNSTLKTWYPLRTLYSQRKHVFLDPATNQPAEVCWPFIAATNYIDLQEPETVDRMGRIEMWELSVLRHATGSTDPVRISVFAHMTDVELTGLTYFDPVLPTAQSGAKKKVKSKSTPKAQSVKKVKVKAKAKTTEKPYKNDPDSGGSKPEIVKPKADEYGSGIVSAPATAVAKAASYFKDVPIIGPFARATEIGSGAISSIAKIFGFSRPSDISDYMSVRNLPIGRLAITSGSDILTKLSLDPKQELCIDPVTVGISHHDELSFLHIAQQETLIDQFPWNINGSNSTGTLYMIPVNPWVQPIYSFSGQFIYAQTALSFLSRPFSYWTGSLRYRFQVVASQFHRGRLLIQYEPQLDANFTAIEPVMGIVGQATNIRYSHIMDLSEERDVTFEVNWAQHEAWRYVLSNGTASGQIASSEGPYSYSSADLIDPGVLDAYNGVLRVAVINSLTAPDVSADIQINVYVSAGDSFQLAAPGEGISGLSYARSGVQVGPPELPSAQSGTFITTSENAPNLSTDYVINGNYRKVDVDANSVYMGEVVSSVRSMLKRYNYHRSISYAVGDVDGIDRGLYNYTFSQRDYPNGPGVYVGNEGSSLTRITQLGINVDYNLCVMTYLRYYGQAFVGYRGGIRWKVICYRSERVQNLPVIVQRRRVGNNSEFGVGSLIMSGDTAGPGRTSLYAQRMVSLSLGNTRSHAGIHASVTGVNPCLEYELPFYSNYRYGELHEPQPGPGASLLPYRYQSLRQHSHNVSTLVTPIYSGASSLEVNQSNVQFDCYVAASEDFSFYIFIGAPPIFVSDVTSVTPV